MDTSTKKAERILGNIVIVFSLVTWALLCVSNINLEIFGKGFGPIDVAKRVTSPDGSKTAILARSYIALDMNFILYITAKSKADIRDPKEKALFYLADGRSVTLADKTGGHIWISHDYDPSTIHNWGEDVVWSEDSLVIAVQIDEQYTFAYDFNTQKSYEDNQQIIELLEVH